MESGDKCILSVVGIVATTICLCSITWFIVEYKTTKVAMQSGYNQVLNIGQTARSGYHWEKSIFGGEK